VGQQAVSGSQQLLVFQQSPAQIPGVVAVVMEVHLNLSVAGAGQLRQEVHLGRIVHLQRIKERVLGRSAV
jgi:hypothetical protein